MTPLPPNASRVPPSVAQGDEGLAARELFATLYAELHRLARKHRSRGFASQAPGTTTLLHETYLGIAGRGGLAFPDRGHFMAYAARAMRGLTINHARGGKALKRGRQLEIVSLGVDGFDAAPPANAELERLGAALDELAEVDPESAQVVDLKFFCGLSFGEIAAMKGLSERTVQRYWEKARLYLHESFGDVDAA
jgi:RNA polymerase sigma factor (TIGR02999 family)